MTLSLSACSSLLVDEIFPMPDSDAGYLGTVGLSDEGFPVLLSSQRGSSSPLDWGEAEVNGSYEPLLPNVVGSDSQPVPYSSLTSVSNPINGDWVCQLFGLGLNDGLPYLASVYDTNAQQWQPGMCLAQYMSEAVPLSSLGTTFLPPGAPASEQSLLLIGLGRDDGRMYLAARQSASGVWQPGAMPMYGVGSQYSALGPCAAVWENLLSTVVIALDTYGFPWLAWYLSWGTGPQPSPAGWYTGPSLPHPTPFQGYAGLSVFADQNSGNLYVFGLGKNDNLPYLIAYLQYSYWFVGAALPNVEQLSQPVQYSTLLTAATPQGEVDVIGLGLCDNQPYLVASSTGLPVFSAGAALPNCQSYGQPVPYAALQTATDQVDNTHLFGLGRDDGQIYHAAWRPNGAASWQQGQGLLPSAYATSWTDAQVFVSMMVSYPGVAATLVNNLQQ